MGSHVWCHNMGSLSSWRIKVVLILALDGVTLCCCGLDVCPLKAGQSARIRPRKRHHCLSFLIHWGIMVTVTQFSIFVLYYKPFFTWGVNASATAWNNRKQDYKIMYLFFFIRTLSCFHMRIIASVTTWNIQKQDYKILYLFFHQNTSPAAGFVNWTFSLMHNSNRCL